MSLITRGLGGYALVTEGLGDFGVEIVEIIVGSSDRIYLDGQRQYFAYQRDLADTVRIYQFWSRLYDVTDRQYERVLRELVPTTRHRNGVSRSYSDTQRTYRGGDRRYN